MSRNGRTRRKKKRQEKLQGMEVSQKKGIVAQVYVARHRAEQSANQSPPHPRS
jgi:hypothetical protein